MARRHKDALAIQLGACNPSGIAQSIMDACTEIRNEPHHAGTAHITSDPAVRLMVHQLAFICGVPTAEAMAEYSAWTKACEEATLERIGGGAANKASE